MGSEKLMTPPPLALIIWEDDRYARAFNKTRHLPELWWVFWGGTPTKIHTVLYKGKVFTASYIALERVPYKDSHLLKIFALYTNIFLRICHALTIFLMISIKKVLMKTEKV